MCRNYPPNAFRATRTARRQNSPKNKAKLNDRHVNELVSSAARAQCESQPKWRRASVPHTVRFKLKAAAWCASGARLDCFAETMSDSLRTATSEAAKSRRRRRRRRRKGDAFIRRDRSSICLSRRRRTRARVNGFSDRRQSTNPCLSLAPPDPAETDGAGGRGTSGNGRSRLSLSIFVLVTSRPRRARRLVSAAPIGRLLKSSFAGSNPGRAKPARSDPCSVHALPCDRFRMCEPFAARGDDDRDVSGERTRKKGDTLLRHFFSSPTETNAARRGKRTRQVKRQVKKRVNFSDANAQPFDVGAWAATPLDERRSCT